MEKTWNNRSNIRIASEKCPTPCEQWDYFVREMTLSNLNEKYENYTLNSVQVRTLFILLFQCNGH